MKGKVIESFTDRNLGGRDLDIKLLEMLSDQVFSEHGERVIDQLKPRLRALEGIEKARKALSGDTEATLSVDNLIGEIEINQEITSDEFNSLIVTIKE